MCIYIGLCITPKPTPFRYIRFFSKIQDEMVFNENDIENSLDPVFIHKYLTIYQTNIK